MRNRVYFSHDLLPFSPHEHTVMDMRLNWFEWKSSSPMSSLEFQSATLMLNTERVAHSNRRIDERQTAKKERKKEMPFDGFNFQFKIANSIAFYQELH